MFSFIFSLCSEQILYCTRATVEYLEKHALKQAEERQEELWKSTRQWERRSGKMPGKLKGREEGRKTQPIPKTPR